MIRKEPEPIVIFVQVPVGTMLNDQRKRKEGLRFGTIAKVARQYGIRSKSVDGGTEFSGPKPRMQIFVEKLHFAMIPYSER